MISTSYINEQGLKEIQDFLASHHKKGGSFTPEMIQAWAQEAEFQMNQDNPPVIEIKEWDSVSGHTEQYEISAAGIDTRVEVEREAGPGHKGG